MIAKNFLEDTFELSVFFRYLQFVEPGLVAQKILALISVSSVAQPLRDIASFEELVSGVPLRPWMHFYKLPAFDIVSLCKSFQVLALAFLLAFIYFATPVNLLVLVLLDGTLGATAHLDFSAHMWVTPRFLVFW